MALHATRSLIQHLLMSWLQIMAVMSGQLGPCHCLACCSSFRECLVTGQGIPWMGANDTNEYEAQFDLSGSHSDQVEFRSCNGM